jgi:regulatory protein
MAGKITALKHQKRNQDRVSVYLDGRFAFGLPAIVAASLRQGQYLSDAEIATLTAQGAVESLYNQALNYLSYRPRSKSEVVSYLRRHGASETEIESTIDRLERAGLLDDEAFAQFWIENREQFRPRGLRALDYELRSKGLESEIIEQALTSVDAAASAYRAASKKAGQLSHLDETTFRRKLVAYLARRGFDYEIAREAAERHWVELTTGE